LPLTRVKETDPMRPRSYAVIYLLVLLVANLYTFIPGIESENAVYHCPSIFGQLSYEISGAAEVVGPPLFAEEQLIVRPGATAYETMVFKSDLNNLTSLLGSSYPVNGSSFTPSGWNPVTQSLQQISIFGWASGFVSAKVAGVAITFQNITFQGIHVADVLYKISANESAELATYDIGYGLCWTGLILTVGYLPFVEALDYGIVQPIGIIVNNAIALIFATIISLAMKTYGGGKNST
jgi:hypothetical protein